MSKAFTSEETPEAELVSRPPPRLAPGEVRYVTPEGQAALRAALARVHDELAEVGRLPTAAQDARRPELERRAGFLQATIAALTVLGPDAAPEGQVAFARWVTVEDEAGERATWRIVGPDEADAKRRLVSVDAPLARALLGRRAGDTATVQRPGSEVELTVVKVRRMAPE